MVLGRCEGGTVGYDCCLMAIVGVNGMDVEILNEDIIRIHSCTVRECVCYYISCDAFGK